MKELWSKRIAAPEPNEDAEARLALLRLIRQVRSVKFGKETQNRAKPAPVELPAVPKVEAPLAPAPLTATPVAVAPVGTANGSALSAKARRTLDSLLQDPSQASDPLELAELLFLNGRPTDAVPFYTKALEGLDRNDVAAAADRAWILFQLANCLRETDMSQAQETYTKLISEYPDSPWTELAHAHNQLLGWYQKDRPQELVATRQP